MNRPQTLSPNRTSPNWSRGAKKAAHSGDRLAAAEAIAYWLDGAFRIPILGTRIGLDPLIGLIPGVGDALTSFASLFILHAASKYGVPKMTLVRMGLNVGLDWMIGAIPFAGDLFDAYWKSNQRNVALLKRHLYEEPANRRRNRTGDRLFVFGIIAVLLCILAGSIAIAVALVTWIAKAIF